MKRVIKPILITLMIMAGLTVGIVYLLTGRDSGPTGEFQNRMAQDQSDLQTDRAYQYDIGNNATALAISGNEKNVLNFDQSNVYNVANSDAARERLDRLIKRTDASFENPIIACNPFGTNENSLYFYFETSYRGMIRYTITVEDETISDHIRYVNNGQENNLSKTHEFIVSGMVPGRTNYIILELLDSSGAKREGKTYQYAMPASDLPARVQMQEGHDKEESNSGLFFVFPAGNNKIAAYDNQGILRNVMVTETGHGKKMYHSGDSILYQVSDNKVVKVSSLGRVTGVVQIKGYGAIRDFSYDGYNEIYSIGRKKKQDYLLATSFETGVTRVVYRFSKKVSLGTLGVPQAGNVCLTASKPFGLIYLDAVTSARPKISFILGKKSAWKKIYGSKVVEDQEVAAWDTGSSILFPSEVDISRQSMLVSKNGSATGIEWQIDTGKKAARVKLSWELGGSTNDLVQVQGEHFIRTNVSQGQYVEYDKGGKMIRQFSYGAPLNSVIKMTLGGMCFYGI